MLYYCLQFEIKISKTTTNISTTNIDIIQNTIIKTTRSFIDIHTKMYLL